MFRFFFLTKQGAIVKPVGEMWNKLLQQSRCFFCSRTETHQPSDLIRKQLLKLCAVRGASGWETRSIIHSNAGIISLQFIRVRWAERISLLIE